MFEKPPLPDILDLEWCLFGGWWLGVLRFVVVYGCAKMIRWDCISDDGSLVVVVVVPLGTATSALVKMILIVCI